jgi:serine/threonine protein kinase
MSPEQCEGSQEVDHRSDVYSLGCLLFEMLTGRCPFAGHTVDVLIAHRRSKPPSVRGFNHDVPPEIDALIQQMLAKRPEQRPQSMAQVVAELTLVERSHSGSMDGPIPVRFPTADIPADVAIVRLSSYKPTLNRAQKRSSIWARLLVAGAALVLTAAAAATIYLTAYNGKLPF